MVLTASKRYILDHILNNTLFYYSTYITWTNKEVGIYLKCPKETSDVNQNQNRFQIWAMPIFSVCLAQGPLYKKAQDGMERQQRKKLQLVVSQTDWAVILRKAVVIEWLSCFVFVLPCILLVLVFKIRFAKTLTAKMDLCFKVIGSDFVQILSLPLFWLHWLRSRPSLTFEVKNMKVYLHDIAGWLSLKLYH